MKFNLKVIGNIIGILLLINGLLMLTAVPFGIYHGEGSWKGILVASLVNSVIGFILYYNTKDCLLYTSPSPRDGLLSRMPSSA